MKMLRFYSMTISLLLCFSKIAAQDTLVFENNHRYPVLIERESDRDVIYRKPGLQNSPLYLMRKRFITSVTYQHPDSAKFKYKPTTMVMKRQLEVWITPTDASGDVKGLLYQLTDSTLFLRKKSGKLEKNDFLKAEMVRLFPYQQIHHIDIRERRQTAKYAILGAAGGFALGTLSGLLVFNKDPECDPTIPDGPCDPSLGTPRSKFEKSLTLGMGTALAGGVGGGIYGSVKVSFPIGGKKDAFNRTIPKLERRARLQVRR